MTSVLYAVETGGLVIAGRQRGNPCPYALKELVVTDVISLCLFGSVWGYISRKLDIRNVRHVKSLIRYMQIALVETIKIMR